MSYPAADVRDAMILKARRNLIKRGRVSYLSADSRFSHTMRTRAPKTELGMSFKDIIVGHCHIDGH